MPLEVASPEKPSIGRLRGPSKDAMWAPRCRKQRSGPLVAKDRSSEETTELCEEN